LEHHQAGFATDDVGAGVRLLPGIDHAPEADFEFGKPGHAVGKIGNCGGFDLIPPGVDRLLDDRI
jgi:hypothetical protein